MFGLFSRKTSAPVTATVSDDRVAVPSAHCWTSSERASDARSSSVIGREPRCCGIPEHEPELGLDHDLPGVVEDALAGRDARAAQLADRALHGHRLEGRVDLVAEVDRAAPDHVLVAADAVLLQEGVAALLEVGEDDGVVDVAQPVEVAPAHLHAVAASPLMTPPQRQSQAWRSGCERRTRSSA